MAKLLDLVSEVSPEAHDKMDKNSSTYTINKTRELLDIDVKEVSVVDNAAIRRKFLVVKRQEVTEMGAFDKESGDKKELNIVEKMQWQEVELPEELTKAIGDFGKWFETTKNDGTPSEVSDIVSFLNKINEGRLPVVEVEKDNTTGSDNDDNDDKGDEIVKSIVMNDDGSITFDGMALEKGGKQFTADRKNTIIDMVGKTLNLLADIDTDAAKSIVEDITGSKIPASLEWTQKSDETAKTTVNIDMGDIKKVLEDAIAPVSGKLNDISARVDEIEKSRPAPKSSDNDVTDNDNKLKKSFWSGTCIAG